MPEAVAVFLVEAAESAVYGEMVLTATQVAAAATALQVVGSVYVLRDQQRRAEARARDSYNASLRDRYAMTRGATEPRALVLGRQRVSGPIAFIRSYGTQNTKLVFCVCLAGHEIDAVEAVYFDDEQVVLDGSGNVTGINRREQFSISAATGSFDLQATPASGTVTATAYYGTTTTALTVTSVTGKTVAVSGANPSATGLVVIVYQPDPNPYAPTKKNSAAETFSVSGGSNTVTLAHTPIAGTVAVVQPIGTGTDRIDYPLTATVSGTSVTFTASVDGSVNITYQWSESPSLARVRVHLGAAGQTADSTMVSNLAGVWTSAHKGAGIAYLTVELDYDESAFPSGIPNVSAQVRGLKCYDPRTSTTAWTQNPALLARAYAIHPLGGRLTSSLVDDASIIAAANVCDTSTNYVVGGKTYTRALYTAGLVARTGTKPQDVLNDLCTAMGGRWALTDGTLKVRAGTYTSPVLAIDETWLSSAGPVSVQPTRNRSDVINAAAGTFADESRNYLVTQYPKVIASAYVTADGTELPVDLNYGAVTFNGQAQYLSACALRYARQGLTVKLTCNLRAYQAEIFDTVTVTLARFGWSAKTFEVLDTSWTLDGGIELTLKEVDSSIWAMDAGFTDIDPAPNTRLPSPWGLPLVAGLSASSGGTTLLRTGDGTIVPRILAQWTAQTDPRVAQQGSIEIRWGVVGSAEATWFSTIVPGSSTSIYLDSVREGLVYVIKARTVGAVAAGDWCAQITHKVVGKSAPPANVSGLATSTTDAGIVISWTACPDVDYGYTSLKVGSSWAAGTALAIVSANQWTWVRPASGTYTIWAKHVDTSGNESTTAASTTVTGWVLPAVSNDLVQVGAANLVGLSAFERYSSLRPVGWDVYNNAGAGYVLTVYPGAPFGTNFVRITNTTSIAAGGSSQFGIYTCTRSPYGAEGGGVVNWIPGQTYVISFWARAAGPNWAGRKLNGLNSNMGWTSVEVLEEPDLINGTWQPYSYRVVPNSGTYTPEGELYISWLPVGSTVPANSEFDVCAAKVELGRVRTGWLACERDNRNTSIGINASTGAISGIGTGAGTVVDNSQLVPSISSAATTATWSGVSGTGRPADNATKNVVTYAASAPSSPTDGDIWVDTGVTPNVIRARISGAWQVASNYTTNTSQLTDGANLGGTAVWSGVSGTGKPADGATVNRVTYSASAPGSPVDGDVWVDTGTSPNLIKLRVSGAWQTGANYTTNTNQLTDGAGLGTTATWSGVSGSGKPADNATVGAPAGTSVAGVAAATVAGAATDYNAQVKTITLSGSQTTFYPVSILASNVGAAVYYDVVVSRPYVHENSTGLGSYTCHIYARSTAWGNAPGALIEVDQVSGYGTYTSGVSNVYTGAADQRLIVMLRGGMTHTISVSQPIGPYTVTAHMSGYSDGSIGTVNSETTGTLLNYLNQAYCPNAPVNWGASIGGTGKPSDYATSDIALVNATPTKMSITGNTIVKTSSDGNWDGSVRSKDGYVGGAYVSFSPSFSVGYVMIGLNTDPTTDDGYASIKYAMYCNASSLWAYESGTGYSLGVGFSPGDVLAVTYDGYTVRYLKNGSVLRSVVANITAALYLDSSFYSVSVPVTGLRFGPLSNVGSISQGQLSLGTISVSFSPSSVTATAPNGNYNAYSSLTATASGGTSPYTYRFTLSDIVLEGTDSARVEISDVSTNVVTLSAKQPLNSQITASVVCVATDANGRTGTGDAYVQITYGTI